MLEFGVYDEIRIYPDPKISRLGTEEDNYKTYYFDSLSKFFKISERNGEDNFYITYDYEKKVWLGKWGKPKLNWKLWINKEGGLECSKKWKMAMSK